MRIYLAARMDNREKLLEQRDAIQALGHVVTSRWLMGDSGSAATMCELDLLDIDSADALLLWADNIPQPKDPYGGCFVEFGYAMARGKKLFVVYPGATRGGFTELAGVLKFKDWSELLAFLAPPKTDTMAKVQQA